MSRSSPGMDKHPPNLTQNSTKRSKRPRRRCTRQCKVAIHGTAARAHLLVARGNPPRVHHDRQGEAALAPSASLLLGTMPSGLSGRQ